jgi:hypothetical protein
MHEKNIGRAKHKNNTKKTYFSLPAFGNIAIGAINFKIEACKYCLLKSITLKKIIFDRKIEKALMRQNKPDKAITPVSILKPTSQNIRIFSKPFCRYFLKGVPRIPTNKVSIW